ncbi:MAG TPA: hypothetical protein PKE45_13620 [Caldilineaceae bacterium]|nr:hypothetical protein [Caldilineaceae bacterium]
MRLDKKSFVGSLSEIESAYPPTLLGKALLFFKRAQVLDYRIPVHNIKLVWSKWLFTTIGNHQTSRQTFNRVKIEIRYLRASLHQRPIEGIAPDS